MFKRVLVANRGEIARRVMRTARKLGIETIAVYSDPDQRACHVHEADRAVRIGTGPAAESYLNKDAILAAARETSAEAIHPGYGFLSENPDFAEAVTTTGIEFIGPSPDSIRLMGLKDAAKRAMRNANVPTVPGCFGAGLNDETLEEEALKLGFPVLIKAVAGGGGKGMRVVRCQEDFRAGLASARSEGELAFGNREVLVEKLVACPRHIEVQVFGDKFGNAVHLFERDCSVQRRHQKIIEEAPAPGVSKETREVLGRIAVRAAVSIGYVGAGTVEFIADGSDGVHPDRCWFMEMNTRLQVEHPVTELVTGVDLVEWQFRVAAGEELPLRQDDLAICGNAMEARIYAEDVGRGFLPSSGVLTRLEFPGDIRVESGVHSGDVVSPYYDPMIAKLVADGATREQARERLTLALDKTTAVGPATNVGFLGAVLRNDCFVKGAVSTDFVDREYRSIGENTDPPEEAVALAALVAAGLGNGGVYDSGFVLWHPLRQEIPVERNGKIVHAVIFVESAVSSSVEIGQRKFKCRFEAGRWWINGISASAPPAVQGQRIAIVLDGFWEFGIPDHLFRETEDHDRDIAGRSPMPGSLRALYVVSGQAVERGMPIAVVEAMKMEHTIAAARNGVVDEVLVQLGDQIEEGSSLITFADESKRKRRD